MPSKQAVKHFPLESVVIDGKKICRHWRTIHEQCPSNEHNTTLQRSEIPHRAIRES